MAEFSIGSAIASFAFNYAVSALFATEQKYSQEGDRLNDLAVVGSQYGAGIPILHGRGRLPGNVIWATPLREVVTRSTESAGGKGGGGAEVTTTTYAYYADFAALLCAGNAANRPLRIWADKKLLWEAPSTTPHLTGTLSGGGTFEFMPGGPSQMPSSIMQGHLGADNTPAYRGRCLIVFNDLPVNQFGNRVPAIEVEVVAGEADAAAYVATLILDLCKLAGLTESQVDVTEVSQEATGARITPGAAGKLLEQVLTGLGLQSVYNGSAIAFRPIEQTVGDDIPETDLLAEGENRFPRQRMREDGLPRVVTVSHTDPDRDFQANAQTARRQVTRSVESVVVSTPLAITAAAAADVADALLYRIWTARNRYGEFGLPNRYLEIEPGDVRGIVVDGRRHVVRFRKITIGANGALRCEGEAYDASVLAGAGSGGSGEFPGQTLPVYGETTLRLYNAPPLTDAESQQIGYRLAATGSGASWRSGVLEVSYDSGATWAAVAALPSYTVMGFCGSTLPDPPEHIGAGNIDTVSTVDVTVIRGELESVTDELLLAGANRAYVGSEMIQFGTATLIGPSTYRLSRLLRGRRATEWAMTDHGADEGFTMLAGSVFVPAQVSDIGPERLYRMTPFGAAAGSGVEESFAISGESARPWSPVDVRGTRTGADLSITWIRRSRVGTELPDTGDIPFDDATEAYEVEILDGSDVVRTLTTVTANVTYTESQQINDFGSAQSAVDVRVYQRNNLVGRSRPTSATV
jgi:hypothetical protein